MFRSVSYALMLAAIAAHVVPAADTQPIQRSARITVDLRQPCAPVSESRVERLNSLFSQAGYDRASNEVVIKTTNYHAQPVVAEIELAGAERVAATGRHLLIKSTSPSDQNTLDQPLRIVPAEKPLESCSRKFTVTLPPYSVNLLRVPAE